MKIQDIFARSFFYSFAIFFFLIISVMGSKKVNADSVNVNLLISVCNANLICEDMIGENYGSCPSDCEAPPPPPPPPEPVNTSISSPGSISGFSGTSGVNSNTLIFPNNNPQVPGTNASSGVPTTNPKSIQKGNPKIPEKGINGTLNINPQVTRVILQFKTFLPSQVTISWGKTGTYELGSSADIGYKQNFSKEISNLDPGTKYYYRLNLKDSIGRLIEYEGQFITSLDPGANKLPAISNFTGLRTSNNELLLTWDLKQTKDSYKDFLVKNNLDTSKSDIYVRVNRSEFNYPTGPDEGKVIYEGKKEEFSDSDFLPAKTYYYALFVVDGEGNTSAPAVLRFVNSDIRNLIGDEKQNPVFYKDGVAVYDPLLKDNTGIIFQDDQDVLIDFSCNTDGKITNSVQTVENQITFMQNGVEIPFMRDRVKLDVDAPFAVRVLGGVIDDIKSVDMCISGLKNNKKSAYILKKTKNYFELIFPADLETFSGKKQYDFSIKMLKYNSRDEVLVEGEIAFNNPKHKTTNKDLIDYIVETIEVIKSLFFEIGQTLVSWTK